MRTCTSNTVPRIPWTGSKISLDESKREEGSSSDSSCVLDHCIDLVYAKCYALQHDLLDSASAKHIIPA